MKRRIATVVLYGALILWACMAAAQTEPGRTTVRVAILADGAWQRIDGFRALIQNEMTELLEGEYNVAFPSAKQLNGDWTQEGIKRIVDGALADPGIDLVVTLGGIASDYVAHLGPLPKPVIAPIVIDVDAQRIPYNNGASGVPNLSYITYPDAFRHNVAVLAEIAPVNKLAVLANKYFANIVSFDDWVAPDNVESGPTYETTVIPCGDSVDEVLASIPEGTDAVYIGPLIHLPETELQRLADSLVARKLPSFAYMGKMHVELGFLSGLVNESTFAKLARRVAVNAQRILTGEDAARIPVAFTGDERLTINMGTARSIGVFPNWGVMTEAELVNTPPKDVSSKLSLAAALTEAIRVNRDLAAFDRQVAAGAENVSQARALLLPDIEISATGVMIDADRAEASFGAQAERTISGKATLTQLIYSEQAWANLSIQDDIQQSLVFDRERLRLDIVQQTATAYLNLLRARTVERIEVDNLKRTRSNLDLARVRESIGSAIPSEVYRWESQIATNRRTVIEANSRRNLAEMELNRILHRAIEADIVTEEVDLTYPGLISNEQRLYQYFGNKWSFKALRKFMVREALSLSPELRQLDAAIAARDRSLQSATSSFYHPTIALQSEISNKFSRSGAGSEGVELPDAAAGLLNLEPADDTDWSIGVNISLPLFEGGGRFSQVRQNEETLLQLQVQRQALAERLEQRTRSGLHTAGASYAAIEQANRAAEASRKTLQIVLDAYSRGAISILDLIDAQNAALIANQLAAESVYAFLIDLIEVERSIGRYFFFASREEQEDFFERLDRFVQEEGL